MAGVPPGAAPSTAHARTFSLSIAKKPGSAGAVPPASAAGAGLFTIAHPANAGVPSNGAGAATAAGAAGASAAANAGGGSGELLGLAASVVTPASTLPKVTVDASAKPEIDNGVLSPVQEDTMVLPSPTQGPTSGSSAAAVPAAPAVDGEPKQRRTFSLTAGRKPATDGTSAAGGSAAVGAAWDGPSPTASAPAVVAGGGGAANDRASSSSSLSSSTASSSSTSVPVLVAATAGGVSAHQQQHPLTIATAPMSVSTGLKINLSRRTASTDAQHHPPPPPPPPSEASASSSSSSSSAAATTSSSSSSTTSVSLQQQQQQQPLHQQQQHGGGGMGAPRHEKRPSLFSISAASLAPSAHARKPSLTLAQSGTSSGASALAAPGAAAPGPAAPTATASAPSPSAPTIGTEAPAAAPKITRKCMCADVICCVPGVCTFLFFLRV